MLPICRVVSPYVLAAVAALAAACGATVRAESPSPSTRPAATADAAPATRPVLPPRTAVVGDITTFYAGGSAGGSMTVEPITVDGQPFTKALRVTTSARPANPWEAQITGKSIAPINKGDALLVRFWGRTVEGQAETGEARSAAILETAGLPFKKSLVQSLAFGPQWRHYEYGFPAAESLPAGGAQLNFHAGYNPQSFEIAGVELINYGTSVSVDDLPGSVTNYAGREANAPWRAAAEARIEKLRKAELRVAVVDAAGRPVPGAKVEVEMTRHAFPFGTAVQAKRLADPNPTPDDAVYRRILSEKFNAAVFENDLKWRDYEQPTRPAIVAAALDWLEQHRFVVRGHVLVWPGWGSRSNPAWKYVPDDLKRLADEKPEGWKQAMRDRIDARVTGAVTDLRGRLVDWDVVNETWSNRIVLELLGREEMVRWFHLSRAADPEVKLYYNDYTMLSGGATEPERIDHLHDTIQFLIDQKAPIDGIGEQGHFGNFVVAPERMLEILDRFAEFGLPIRITEFDVNTADEQLQADYTRDFYTAAFSHPAVNGILMWGFWEGAHWAPDAALYRRDWTPKPNAKMYEDLVYNRWWTRAGGETATDGTYLTRGFHGDYRITVTAPGKPPRVMTATLTPAAEPVTVRVD